jgi:hypothetical protein
VVVVGVVGRVFVVYLLVCFLSFVDCVHFCVGGYCGCCVVVDCFLFVVLLLLFVVFIIVVVIIEYYCLGILVMTLLFAVILMIYI